MGVRVDPVRLGFVLSRLALWAGFVFGVACGWGYWNGYLSIVEALLFLVMVWVLIVLGVVLNVEAQVYGLVELVDVNNWVLEMLARRAVYPGDRGWQVALQEWLDSLDEANKGGEDG